MLIPLPNITYDVQEALDYYETLKRDFADLMWTKQEMVAYANIEEVQADDQVTMFLDAMGRKEPFISFSREKILEIISEKRWLFTGKVTAWNISVPGEEGYHPKIAKQHELQFGFAKKILEKFPEATMLQLISNPVGTKYHRHSDTTELVRVIIPIISDAGAVWHFDDVRDVPHYPGCAYIAITQVPHATDVFGPLDKVTLTFLLKPTAIDWLKNYNCKI